MVYDRCIPTNDLAAENKGEPSPSPRWRFMRIIIVIIILYYLLYSIEVYSCTAFILSYKRVTAIRGPLRFKMYGRKYFRVAFFRKYCQIQWPTLTRSWLFYSPILSKIFSDPHTALENSLFFVSFKQRNFTISLR